MTKIIKSILKKFLYFFLRFIPIKKTRVCVLANCGTIGYNGNPRFICDELIGSGLEIIWGYKGEIPLLPTGIICCDLSSIKWLFYLLTSKVWIDNCRKSFPYKKEKTLYINTWHGGGMQKKCEKDAIGSSLSKKYIKMAQHDSDNIDILISDSREMTKLYYSSFWFKNSVMEIGYPRYYPLLRKDLSQINLIKQKYNINSKFVVLYAPTFRDSYDISLYNLEVANIKEAVKERFKTDCDVLIKLHPNFYNKKILCDFNGFILVNQKENLQYLLSFVDLIISDYSSIIFDCSINGTPGLRYMPDFNKYENERGLYYDINAYPWPLAETPNSLYNNIRNFDLENYKDKLEKFHSFIGLNKSIDSSKIISQMIKEYCLMPISKKDLVDKWKTH